MGKNLKYNRPWDFEKPVGEPSAQRGRHSGMAFPWCDALPQSVISQENCPQSLLAWSVPGSVSAWLSVVLSELPDVLLECHMRTAHLQGACIFGTPVIFLLSQCAPTLSSTRRCGWWLPSWSSCSCPERGPGSSSAPTFQAVTKPGRAARGEGSPAGGQRPVESGDKGATDTRPAPSLLRERLGPREAGGPLHHAPWPQRPSLSTQAAARSLREVLREKCPRLASPLSPASRGTVTIWGAVGTAEAGTGWVEASVSTSVCPLCPVAWPFPGQALPAVRLCCGLEDAGSP